jgi:23S rRNA (uracil1939-C5)-methyltransferase
VTLVEIERLAAGGDGVGRLADGLTVFVPRTAPGDVAEVEIIERKARFARGRAVGIARGAPTRVEPACPHYVDDRCGGCQLQHVSLAEQLELKRRIVGDAVRRIGGLAVDDPEITPSPLAWRYRSRITLSVAGRTIGLHRFDDPGEIFPLQDCLITAHPLMDLWGRVRAHVDNLPEDAESLVLRLDRAGAAHLVVAGGTRPWDAAPLAGAVGVEGVSYWWKPVGGAARVMHGKRTGYPVTAFEQVNPVLAGTIRDAAVAALGDVAGTVIWDLYGGVGDTARALAALGAKVWSVDADRGAIEWARTVPGDVKFVAARAEDALDRLPEPGGVVVNPPRTGLDRRVCAVLERLAGARRGIRVAYVSCDPATLARDIKRMPSLRLHALGAYDLFPQTAHVEALAVLEAR